MTHRALASCNFPSNKHFLKFDMDGVRAERFWASTAHKTQLASFSDVGEAGSDFQVKQCSDLLRLLCISSGQTAVLVAIVTTNSSHPTLLDRSWTRPARPTEDCCVPSWFMELPHGKILLALLLKLPRSAAKVAAVRLTLGVRLAGKLS